MMYRIIHIIFALYSALMIQGCALNAKSQKAYEKKPEVQLTEYEQSLVDRWSKDKIPSCRFVYTTPRQANISRFYIKRNR